VPPPTAVTSPVVESTVATASLPDEYLTGSVPVCVPEQVAVRVAVSPIFRVRLELSVNKIVSPVASAAGIREQTIATTSRVQSSLLRDFFIN